MWPVMTRAQQRALPVVGYINAEFRGQVEAFRRGLRETGLVQGQNVAIDDRFAENQRDRVPQFVVDFIKENVAVIVSAGGTEQATTIKAAAATSRIPVVFTSGADPVQNGLVASLNRPGGDLTGVNMHIADLWPKQFDLLTKLLPNGHVFARLFAAPSFAVRPIAALVSALDDRARSTGSQSCSIPTYPRIALYALIGDGGPSTQGRADHCACSWRSRDRDGHQRP